MSARTQKFIGRVKELELLDKAYTAAGSSFIPIYGRRRVGKSELILQFLADHPGLYYVGKRAPAEPQIREFLHEAARVVEDPVLASVSPSDWKTALELTVARWRGRRKLVLALDEFQWTAGASPELPSVIQELWDRQWQACGDIVLILCGSYVGFMEREVLGRKSPLFGRRTAQIFLKPFGFREAGEFHRQYSETDRARAYFVCGGIPLYLNCFTDDRSVEANLAENLLSEFAPLYREPDFLLREELREVETYYAVLLAIAAGHHTNLAISKETGIGERALYYYLQQLVELGYVSRRYPLTGRKAAKRHVRFALEDPLLRFWFRFVYPNNSFISHMGGTQALKDRIRPELDAYFGSCFERLCREALPAVYESEGVSAAFEIGEYWDKATQIDVVGYRDDGWTDLGECKWGTVRSARRIASELEDKVGRYPNERNASVGRRVFTRARVVPPSNGASDVIWHCLEDLYSR